jgi:hypothetical protein
MNGTDLDAVGWNDARLAHGARPMSETPEFEELSPNKERRALEIAARPRDIAAELAVYKRALVNIFKHFYADWEEQMALWLAEAAEQVDAPGGGTDEEH